MIFCLTHVTSFQTKVFVDAIQCTDYQTHNNQDKCTINIKTKHKYQATEVMLRRSYYKRLNCWGITVTAVIIVQTVSQMHLHIYQILLTTQLSKLRTTSAQLGFVHCCRTHITYYLLPKISILPTLHNIA